MINRLCRPALLLFVGASLACAAEYRVEALPDKPPAELGADVAAQLAPSGYKVINAGDNSAVCEVWLARKFDVKADFKPTNNILYPFEYGSLVGALRFPKKGADFRGQEIKPGAYTLRYGVQPETGTHVGTFETRDFLVMLPAKDDQSIAPISNEEQLAIESAKSAEATHPAIMPLMRSEAGAAPAMKHYEDQEWWTVQLSGQGPEGRNIPLELIVVGKAAE